MVDFLFFLGIITTVANVLFGATGNHIAGKYHWALAVPFMFFAAAATGHLLGF